MNDKKFYAQILEQGPPPGKTWHEDYIKYLKQMSRYSNFVNISYTGPIYEKPNVKPILTKEL